MITVILCSYHGEKYIEAQRQSILNQQTKVPFRLREYDDEVRKSGSAAANFLSAIREAPESDYYMLSDQDDVWHPDKIDKLYNKILEVEELTGKDKPIIVHSDARVVDSELNLVSNSFVSYQGLSPCRTALPQLLIMNQVTGAACIFNHTLKKLLQDHPMPQHVVMHDQWLALIAACLGNIQYLPEALYDYRQHGQNVLGARRSGAFNEGRAMFENVPVTGSRKAYTALSAQAGEFLEQYRDMLDDSQKEVLQAFATLPKMSKSERIANVIKYGFTYNRFYRVLGEIARI